MKKAIVLFLVICLASVALFACGAEEADNAQSRVTILAEVTEVSGTVLTVRGLAEGYGSDYRLDTKGASVVREGEEQIAAEIEVGDKISITFSGIALKNYPGTLLNVTKVVKMKV